DAACALCAGRRRKRWRNEWRLRGVTRPGTAPVQGSALMLSHGAGRGRTVESTMTQLHGADAGSGHTAALPGYESLIAALRRGEEAAFALLLDTYYTSMVRVAMQYVSSHAVAEEVVQETWLEVFRGLERFEARCALKTWIFRILTNVAKTRGQREARS